MRDYSGSLMVMLAHACSLKCAACGVALGPKRMPWKTLARSVDLLLASDVRHLQLRYFGGEPLLEFGLIQKAVAYAEARGAELGKRVHHMVVTNGLGLDERKLAWLKGRDVEFLFSLDGKAETHAKWRAAPSGQDVHPRLVANLRRLQGSGLSYFVNMVAHPGDSREWISDLEFAAGLGVRRIQLGYEVGSAWSSGERSRFLEFLEAAARVCKERGIELLNLKSGAEPVMLSDEVIVETDGGLYLDPAVFVERFFPGLKSVMRLGRLDTVSSLGEVRRTRAQVLELFRKRYPPSTAKGRLFLDNLGLGLSVNRLLARLSSGAGA